ncbi:MAG TPA: calcium-binding protein, partial [Aurantimonas sp.]|nr:calcium-binding protein [Aurantimonas sp.]
MATIDGDDGDNALNGTNESDLIRAFGGDDDIFFSSGFDEIHGGYGFDQIRYETLFQGIVVNFTGFGSGTVTKYYGPGNFETDTFFEIEGIVGTQYADGFNNSSDGYARFRGLQGADVYNGSATGFDEVDYLRDANFGGHNGVVIDLAAGTGTDGFGNTEVLSNIDGVRGTQYADLLIGSSGNNDLNGEGGNDVLQGGAGEDLLIGGNGSDLLEGGEGDDQLEGDAGSDTLIGGDGFDALNYRADPLGITAIFTGDLAGTVEQGDGSIDVFQEIEAVLG